MPFAGAREDILQEVNLLVWEKRHKFTMGTNFRAWIFSFARNVTMKHQKRARREHSIMFTQETIEFLADDFVEDHTDLEERLQALRGCLKKINPKERTLLLRHYTSRGASERAAEAMGRSSSAVRGMLHRLRIALRRCIERELKFATSPRGENA